MTCNPSSDAIYRLDGIVMDLEDEGFDFAEILKAMAEYVSICEDIYGK